MLERVRLGAQHVASRVRRGAARTDERAAAAVHAELAAASGASVTRVSDVRTLYELGAELGRGRTSTVFEAVERTSGQRVALKTLSTATLAADREELASVGCELRAMRALPPHPHIAQLRGVLVSGEHVALVLELVCGGDLLGSIERDGAYTEACARCILAQLASALWHCHAHGVCHRDVKPENVCFVRTDGCGERPVVKLIDFGLADFFAAAEPPSDGDDGLRGLAGTAVYAAPEVMAWYWEEDANLGDAGTQPGSRTKPAGLVAAPYGRRCDVWAAGVVLHAALVAELPFGQALPIDELLHRCARIGPDWSAPGWAAVSAGARELVASMLAPRADQRPHVRQLCEHAWLRDEVARVGRSVAAARALSLIHI